MKLFTTFQFASLVLPFTVAAQDLVDFDQQVRDALLRNPEIILEVFDLLEAQQAEQAAMADTELLSSLSDRLFEGADLSKPILVEFFDYNCGYCKRGAGEVAIAAAEVDDLQLLHLQFPILGEASVEMARAMLGLRDVHGDDVYFRVHDLLMADDGRIKANFDGYLASAGFDVRAIHEAASGERVTQALASAQSLARALQISGTPAYVTKSRVMRGYVEAAPLTAAILDDQS